MATPMAMPPPRTPTTATPARKPDQKPSQSNGASSDSSSSTSRANGRSSSGCSNAVRVDMCTPPFGHRRRDVRPTRSGKDRPHNDETDADANHDAATDGESLGPPGGSGQRLQLLDVQRERRA